MYVYLSPFDDGAYPLPRPTTGIGLYIYIYACICMHIFVYMLADPGLHDLGCFQFDESVFELYLLNNTSIVCGGTYVIPWS
jgi:hypothetical protein